MRKLFKKSQKSKKSMTEMSSSDSEPTRPIRSPGPLEGWGVALAGPSAPVEPSKAATDLVTYDIVGNLTVNCPRSVDHQLFFGRMSLNFPHYYQGDIAMKPFHSAVFAKLVSELRSAVSSPRGWLYSSRVAECVTFQGKRAELPQGTTSHFRDVFSWQYRGDIYTWTVDITWVKSHMPGIPLSEFLKSDIACLLQALNVTTVWNEKEKFLALTG
ncbi:MAG: matrix protein [Nanning Rhabd tick virus 1]|uniref:Matrix protein n=1 Tax=Nanning Rhabd tick virus 1 TaxID=2972321 RepID=A0A9E7V2A2_9RHAB|nr:MAG: matrix protein [Nanning Rhabd tick virus 1]